MCGRFTLKAAAMSLQELFDLSECPTLPPRFNIAPTQNVAAIRADANWATIFTFPDLLHGTARHSVPQEEITIGLASPRDPAAPTLGRLLVLPIRPEHREREVTPGDTRSHGPPLELAA